MVDDSTRFDGMNPYEALLAAVDILGSQAELARVCGVSGTAVWKWVQSSKRVPGEYVLAVEEATGIPCYVLCPSTYPPARFRPNQRFLGVDRRAPRVSFKSETILKGAQA
jgi:DNA-binding transcriptional regulator YdaS (Cro superfamily)